MSGIVDRTQVSLPPDRHQALAHCIGTLKAPHQALYKNSVTKSFGPQEYVRTG